MLAKTAISIFNRALNKKSEPNLYNVIKSILDNDKSFKKHHSTILRILIYKLEKGDITDVHLSFINRINQYG